MRLRDASISVALFLALYTPLPVTGLELPENEVQVNFNSYIDNFNVTIGYPSFSITRRASERTSLSGRYVVDVISSASMQARFEVDGITSATMSSEGGGDDTPDELRHETGLGITRLIGDGTISVNGIYSTEHDYQSSTVAGRFSHPFSKNNTVVQLGLVQSWDDVFPQTRHWVRDKEVTSWSAGLTRVLHPRSIIQFDLSYIVMSGELADLYQVVTIVYPDSASVAIHEPNHPKRRVRRAAGVRANLKTSSTTSLQIGYRYYTDSWDIQSNTVHGLFQKSILQQKATVGFGIRYYMQNSADFFQDEYRKPQEFMTVDSKLNKSNSQEYQFKFSINGELLSAVPFLHDDRIDLDVRLNLYHRQTDTADWFSRRKDLNAYITSLGIRYRY